MKTALCSTLPRQYFSQKMRPVLSSWTACFAIILSKSVLCQTQTTPNMHLACKIGEITKLLIFSFPCFKISHPYKTHCNIIMMPSHNSCQKATNLPTPPLRESRPLEFLRSHCMAKFPSPRAWIYFMLPPSL